MRHLPFRIAKPMVFVAALVTSACSPQPAQVTACEARLMPTLKAPSTYHRVRSTVGAIAKNGLQNVFIEYDASNEYNAPLRSTFWCVFDPKTGQADQHDDSSLTPDNLDDIQDTTTFSQPKPSLPSPVPVPTVGVRPTVRTEAAEEEVPVCDRPDSPEKFALMNEIGTDCTGE